MKLNKFALTPPIAAIIILLTLTASAAPKVVYVVPGGAGEKDGTSWENAYGSVHDAYASAAAFAEGGFDSGEVWVKRGMYIWPSKNSAITMVSGVSVRGGFVGTETSADQADGAANVTVFSGDLQSDAYWCPDGVAPKPIEAKHRIWTGDNDHLVYNEPNPDGTDKYWAINKSLNDVQKAFSGNGVTGCEFTGLHFACFVTSAISLSNTTGGAVTFRKCLFLGNDGAQNGGLYDGGIHCVYGHCSIYDCEFVANWSQLSYATDTLATGTGYTVISNCVFRKMASSGFYLRLESSAGLDDNTYRLQNCVFKDNYGSSMISVNATKLFRLNVEDCLFVSNRTVGSSIVYSQANSAGQMKFRRCVFADNVISNASNGACSGCVAMGGWGRGFFFNDCLFARNTLTYTGTTSGAAVIGQLLASYVSTAFVNCTFDQNKTVSTAEGTYACIIGFLTDYMSLGIANCTFRTNVCQAAGENAVNNKAYIYSTKPQGSASVTVANCIFETDDPDFSIYKTRERGGWSFFCGITVPDISKIDTSTYGGRVDTITDDDPKLRDEVLVGENGAFALGVDVNSPVRKKGFALYSSDSDPVVYYIHVPHKSGNADKTWHNLPGNGSYSDAEALQKGISTASPLVPDAFGAPRTDGKIAYGPLNAPTAGLMLLLR